MSIDDEEVLTAGERLEDEEDERLREGVRNSLLASAARTQPAASNKSSDVVSGAIKPSVKPS